MLFATVRRVIVLRELQGLLKEDSFSSIVRLRHGILRIICVLVLIDVARRSCVSDHLSREDELRWSLH